jgi:phenylacetate-CoA ligase
MSRVQARTDDMLIIKGVNVFPSQFEELVMLDDRLTPHFVLEVIEDGHLDALRVLIEPEPDAAGDAALAAEFAEVVRQRIGVSVDVMAVEPGTIERSEGKAKRVRDLRSR